MKLSHIVIASTAALSFGAWAEGNKSNQDRHWQSGASASMQHESQASSSAIREAQQQLRAAGHDAGPVDGIMGPRTAQALKDFQQEKGLEVSGRLDQRTRAELGLGSSAIGASSAVGAQGKVGTSSRAGTLNGVTTPGKANESFSPGPAGSKY